MTAIKLSGLAAALSLTAAAFLAGAPAEAHHSKEYFSEVYTFSKPTNGYSGWASGGYYCDYQKKPNIVCSADGTKCARKGWQLRQHCY